MALTRVHRFGSPGDIREFAKGRFEVLEVGGLTLGRATYEPGWRWSSHVGAASGVSLCQVEHIGMVLSGRVAVSFPGREERELVPGDVFHIPPGHDSWVIGDEPYVSLHFFGAASYAKDPANGAA